MRAALLFTGSNSIDEAYSIKRMSDYASEMDMPVTVQFDSVDGVLKDGGQSYDVVLTTEDIVISGVEVIRVD